MILVIDSIDKVVDNIPKVSFVNKLLAVLLWNYGSEYVKECDEVVYR